MNGLRGATKYTQRFSKGATEKTDELLHKIDTARYQTRTETSKNIDKKSSRKG